MDKNEILSSAVKFTRDSPFNVISDKVAIHSNYTGMKIFDSPIFAFGSAADELYERYLSSDIIGDHFITPAGWLPAAKTVISFFLPYTERIRSANAADYRWPAGEWLHGRYEGQLLVTELSRHINNLLLDNGYRSLVPTLDARYKNGSVETGFTSNWSERHAAFACGLGTFGLSKGIITKNGTCGRFGSVITELALPADGRPYQDTYEYCIQCGLCAAHCPVYAISLQEGKKHPPCSAFLDKVREKENPRYGCGKCQIRVPCESKIPNRTK